MLKRVLIFVLAIVLFATNSFAQDFIFKGDISQPQFIFIEGGSLDHPIRDTHERMTRYLARVMIKDKGVKPENLHFLSDSTRNFEVYENLIDAPVTEDNIRRALKAGGQSPASFIYLCGEGFEGYVTLRKGLKLYASQLGSWMSQFELENTILVVETAYPQEFLEQVVVNGGERIIKIAPAESGQSNALLESGMQSFTGMFSLAINFHDDLNAAYAHTEGVMESMGNQIPISQVNGNWGRINENKDLQKSLVDLGQLLFITLTPQSPTGSPISDAILNLQKAAGLR